MARHEPRWTPQVVRDRIRATKIVNRLQAFVLDEKCDGKMVRMSREQVAAALGLLRKTVPDLSQTALTGPDGKALPPPVFNFGFKNGGPGSA